VTYIEGNTIELKMSTGELRVVTVPDSRTAMVDGREVNVHGLKVGTQLTATITTSTTPVTDRTVSNLTATVWHVSAPNVILTLPDGTNKMYKATPQMKFDVNGQKATVFDLKKGMRITCGKDRGRAPNGDNQQHPCDRGRPPSRNLLRWQRRLLARSLLPQRRHGPRLRHLPR
jgi:hypothetical protein